MAKCIFCDGELPPNNPDEHIILNAIGGRLKTNRLVCWPCNSRQNDEIDTILADELNFITNLLDVKRERGGSPAPIYGTSDKTGETVKMMPGGKPELEKPKIDIQRSDTEERRTYIVRSEKELKKHLESIRKEGHTIDIEKEIREAKRESKHPGPVKMKTGVGGAESFRSVCKTALLQYLQNGGNPEYAKDVIAYVDGKKTEDVVGHYQPPANIVSEGSGVTHRIYIKGDTKQKLLYAWVEYYGSFGFGIVLNENYDGGEYESSYCYDVVEQREIENCPKVSVLRNELLDIVKNKKYSYEIFKEKFSKLLNFIMRKQREEYLLDKVKELAKKYFPDGIIRTQEQMIGFTTEFGQCLQSVDDGMSKEEVEDISKKVTAYLKEHGL